MTTDTSTAPPSTEGGAVRASRFNLTVSAEAAAEALHEAAIYFEAGHYLTFTGAQVAAILAERIAALDEAYVADLARTPQPKDKR